MKQFVVTNVIVLMKQLQDWHTRTPPCENQKVWDFSRVPPLWFLVPWNPPSSHM